MIEYIAIGMIIGGFWIAFEIWRAPLMDENGRILKEGKKISNLFKKKNKNQ